MCLSPSRKRVLRPYQVPTQRVPRPPSTSPSTAQAQASRGRPDLRPRPRRCPEPRAQGPPTLPAGPGSDGIVVTWKDNFDSFYSEVAELGRYTLGAGASSEGAQPGAPPALGGSQSLSRQHTRPLTFPPRLPGAGSLSLRSATRKEPNAQWPPSL